VIAWICYAGPCYALPLFWSKIFLYFIDINPSILLLFDLRNATFFHGSHGRQTQTDQARETKYPSFNKNRSDMDILSPFSLDTVAGNGEKYPNSNKTDGNKDIKHPNRTIFSSEMDI